MTVARRIAGAAVEKAEVLYLRSQARWMRDVVIEALELGPVALFPGDLDRSRLATVLLIALG